jgi:hypothetical protein
MLRCNHPAAAILFNRRPSDDVCPKMTAQCPPRWAVSYVCHYIIPPARAGALPIHRSRLALTYSGVNVQLGTPIAGRFLLELHQQSAMIYRPRFSVAWAARQARLWLDPSRLPEPR